MRLNNHIISSLYGLHASFSFDEAWSKRDIIVRDLAPSIISYVDAGFERACYNALAHPSGVMLHNGAFVFADGNAVDLKLDEDERKVVGKLMKDDSHVSQEDAIRIIALFKLAGEKVADVSQVINPVGNTDANVILLKNGQHIGIAGMKLKPGMTLRTKMIRNVSRQACKVGKVTLQGGQYTYGVFCGNNLVAVSPREGDNTQYYLEYVTGRDGVSCLQVTNRFTGNIVQTYPKAHFFTMLGNDDYAFIDGLAVRCYKSQYLSDEFSRIDLFDEPQIIEYDKENKRLTITLVNSKTININY